MRNNNIPKVRFKQFKGLWNENKIGNIVSISAGGDIDRFKLKNKGKYPVIANALTNKGIVGFYDDYKVKAPAVTVTGRGDVGYAVARHENFTPIVRLLTLQSENIDVDYLENQINSMRILNESTGVPQLTAPQLGNYKVYHPEIEEQSAIGSLFRTLDDLLASYKDNLANYQFLKATMLSKMLPKAGQTVPEIRLEGFEGEWENIRLGDCAIIKGRLGWKSLKQEEYTEVGPSMIAGKHIKNGVIDWGEVDHIPQWRYDESPDIMLEEGDIIFSKDGSLGNPALVSNLKGEATINSTMMLVRLDKEVSSQFFYHILTSSVFQKLIYLKVSGSSIPHLFQADMQDFKFYAPSIEEQQAIGSYFSNIDNLIASHQEKISQLETLKKKLLQDMFI
ncbi:restriction endonuclease subunit S [Streptococcus parasanguinis]|uniref:restriction endonuclease subunit S n=1 Tax=Streptococcus parasanguinis TaxID=1318 RepID=UPI0039C03CBC